MRPSTAILIVNGGLDPRAGRWLDLCLAKIRQFTPPGSYHIYLWNNNLNDKPLREALLQASDLTYLEAAPYERLAHKHAVPLQRLYTLARDEGAETIVTMDSDAHPLRSGWLAELLSALDAGAALAGVWRDELSQAIEPYIHPSLLAVKTAFVEAQGLRFDRLRSPHDTQLIDTLSYFTTAALTAGKPLHRLMRSNHNQFHHLMGGVYADLVYHHGAGSRGWVTFWDTPKGQPPTNNAEAIRDASAELLFREYEKYMAWLRGQPVEAAFARQMQQLSLTPPARRKKSASLKERARNALKKIPGLVQFKQLLSRRRHPPGPGGNKKKMLRPLGLADLHDLPHGWQITGPAFIGVGAPKCGTSWWYNLILEHPQITANRVRIPKNKELHYFVHFQSKPLDEQQLETYRQMFAAPPGAICGEFSTSYLSYPNTLEQVAQAAPQAKILVMLRNPIDRLLSHLNHMHIARAYWFKGLNADQARLFKQYPLYSEAALYSLYAVGLRRLFRYYAPEQVLILQYERCVRETESELRRTYRFLGLDETFVPDNLNREVNVKEYVLPRFTPEERARLSAYFADDVAETLALCPALNADLWPDFAQK
jgi:hypothetical protein